MTYEKQSVAANRTQDCRNHICRGRRERFPTCSFHAKTNLVKIKSHETKKSSISNGEKEQRGTAAGECVAESQHFEKSVIGRLMEATPRREKQHEAIPRREKQHEAGEMDRQPVRMLEKLRLRCHDWFIRVRERMRRERERKHMLHWRRSPTPKGKRGRP